MFINMLHVTFMFWLPDGGGGRRIARVPAANPRPDPTPVGAELSLVPPQSRSRTPPVSRGTFTRRTCGNVCMVASVVRGGKRKFLVFFGCQMGEGTVCGVLGTKPLPLPITYASPPPLGLTLIYTHLIHRLLVGGSGTNVLFSPSLSLSVGVCVCVCV
jgi:hypothetical protein